MASPTGVRRSPQYWALTAFVVLAFLMGGGSRADVASLIVLRPLAVIASGFGLATLTRTQARRYRSPLAFAAAAFLVVAVQLIPLPPSIWHALPGRAIVAEVDNAAGLGAVWRPLTMAPASTWNALFSLFVPLAVLLLGVQLSFEDRAPFVSVIIAMGVVSGVLGLLQITGGPDSPLYLYRNTTSGAAVGLFANRNHAATLLAVCFPLLAIFAAGGNSGRSYRNSAALTIGLVLVPLLLVTGSRAGLLLGVLGVLAALSLQFGHGDAANAVPKKRVILLTVVGLGGIAMLFLAYSRAEALERLLSTRNSEEFRFQAWSPIGSMIWKYFPVGAGFGSFAPVFQIDEPYSLLRLTYLNHAHNDWLETAMDGGLAGMLMIGLPCVYAVRHSILAMRPLAGSSRRVLLARAAAAILGMFAVASLFDYPLRVPSLQCVAVLALLWLTPRDRAATD